jgi:hypothetical protein
MPCYADLGLISFDFGRKWPNYAELAPGISWPSRNLVDLGDVGGTRDNMCSKHRRYTGLFKSVQKAHE